MITRKPVTSSNIKSIGYDEHSETLVVEFTSLKLYQYIHVAPIVHQELLAAPSIGSYFSRVIKAHPEIYPCEQIIKPEAEAPAAASPLISRIDALLAGTPAPKVPPVEAPATDLCITEITVRQTFNTGNYENVVIEATAVVDPREGPNATAAKLKKWVAAQDPRPQAMRTPGTASSGRRPFP